MTNQQPKIKKVVIAGGGTSGWMAAAALSKILGHTLEIVLVESDEIETVGVGEATIPSMQKFHAFLEIDELDFLKHTHGTFKLGINFENWRNVGEDYLHAFGFTGQDHWTAGFQHFWTRGRKLGLSEEYGEYCFEKKAAENQRFAHVANNGLNYAYHIDASQYARFLRRFSEPLGVRRIEGRITSVDTDESSGFIRALRLASGQVITGDFFLDCTGFRALLIEQTLSTGYESWSHWLPCDSAVAIQTESTQPAIPYTRSIAHEAGWQWRIPLQTRTGNGLVYSSKFMSDDEAVAKIVNNIEGNTLTEPKVIKYSTGRRLKQWNKNCLAVGLSSGFLEPLESTSIHLIQQNILRLIRLFPIEGIKQCDIDEFNYQANFDVEKIRDFIILHYKVTNRADSRFWIHCRNMDIPDTLRHRIDLFRETGRVFREGNELFDDSWQQVMIGQGIVPDSYHPIADRMSEEELARFLKHIQSNIQGKVEQLPDHSRYLQTLCGAA